MISLKKYLDSTAEARETQDRKQSRLGSQGKLPQEMGGILASTTLVAYRSALHEMGLSSLAACPAMGQGLMQDLSCVADQLERRFTGPDVESAENAVRERLQEWGSKTAGHYGEKTAEVKQLLLLLAHTADSVGERDHRCGGQMREVMTHLEAIATLDDLSEIRLSVERSAASLKDSLDRMDEEGKQATAKLRAEVDTYRARLEEAEELASRDGLTGLRNRSWIEGQITNRIDQGAIFSIAMVDIDQFKTINDAYGHLAGDDLLRQFAGELKSASRSKDLIGRWGGDEFVLVLDSGGADAESQVERLRAWVCGNYTLRGTSDAIPLKVEASIGLAQHEAGQKWEELLGKADAAMYRRKAEARTNGGAMQR
jgi:diguanylate cyclase (GGDEF)-like protein